VELILVAVVVIGVASIIAAGWILAKDWRK
jgi:hypothetical protein